jgi:hypothetical protein
MAVFAPIVFLMILLGGAAVLAFLVFIFTRFRFAPAVVAGGGAVLLGLAMLAIFYWSMAGVPRAETVQMYPNWAGGQINDAARGFANEIQSFQVSVGEGPPRSIGASWVRIMLFLILIGVLIFVVVRRIVSPHHHIGQHKMWPVFFALPVIAFIFVMSWVRVRSSHEWAGSNEAARQIAQDAIAQHQTNLAVRAQQQLSQHNLEEQMNKFDAPRIPLSPVAEAPSAVTPTPAAPIAPGKAVAQSSSKHKKTSKPSATNNEQPKKDVAKSTSGESSGNDKGKPKSRDKSVTIAAESEDRGSGAPPAWIHEEPKVLSGTQKEVIETEEYQSRDDCRQAMEIYLLLKTHQYLQELAGHPTSGFELPSISFRQKMVIANGNVISIIPTSGTSTGWIDPRLRELARLGIGIDFIRNEVVAKDSKGEPKEYLETIDHPDLGPMKRLYVQIEFSPHVKNSLRRFVEADQRERRLTFAGVGAGSVFGLLGLAFALLKLDTWTKGYYTKRLFLGLPAAIILGLLLLSLFIGFMV